VESRRRQREGDTNQSRDKYLDAKATKASEQGRQPPRDTYITRNNEFFPKVQILLEIRFRVF
jgi:hypothetical protein